MNVFELLGIIAINNKGANKSIDETMGKAKGLSAVFGKVGKGAVALGKTVAKGMTVVAAAGAAATAALLKSSIGNYAEYEQLVGGIETLFKDSQDTVLKYAKNAYKTAGLSANDYMATATSFAASLLQGLGGDTAAAATMTDMAIQDMADNANKMGTDISMIQNAYQGFAKQNFTMLDNLKLGYGGTKEEMARLINDSGVMGETMVVTAENLNEISFAKMIEAIHVIQKEMGITGTTAKEAEKTITGSFNAWKSAGSNLLTAIASGDTKSMSEATTAFTEQTKILLANLKPVVLNVIESIGTLLTELLPDILSTAWDFGAAVIAELVNGITGSNITGEDVKAAVQSIIDAVVGVWETVTTTVSESIAAVDKFFNVTIPEAYNSFVQSVVDLWTETIAPAIDSAATSVAEFFGIDVPENWSLTKEITDAWNSIISTIETAIEKIKEFLGLNKDPEEEKNRIYDTPIGPQPIHKTAGRYAHWTEVQQDAAREYIGNMLLGYDDAYLLHNIGLSDEAITNFRADISELLASGEYTVEIEDAMFESGTQTKLQSQLNNMMLTARIKAVTEYAGNAANFLSGFGAKWNADGAVFSEPTIFNTRLGLQGVGEAGPEAVAPIGVLQGYVTSAVRSEVGRLEATYNSMLNVLQTIAQNTAAGHTVVMDTGALVGQMAPRLDAQLGILTARKERRG